MLFSEPKIPQSPYVTFFLTTIQICFSALQRAENSSIVEIALIDLVPTKFQCSSASRKFLNRRRARERGRARQFQCSSASRKFLNARSAPPTSHAYEFQCSSASRKFLNRGGLFAPLPDALEFQCSSASRKFLNVPDPSNCARIPADVSVLFSEPKIPQ